MKKTVFFLLSISLVFLVACTTKAPTENIVSKEDFVRILVSEITSEMKTFSYDSNGITVKYFVVKRSDGEIRTAFDACDVCGGYMGYSQQGNQVVCNKCGNRFNIDLIGVDNSKGGCWPSYLDHKIKGDNLLISKKELSEGSFRFA